jgi:hypothetical protein
VDPFYQIRLVQKEPGVALGFAAILLGIIFLSGESKEEIARKPALAEQVESLSLSSCQRDFTDAVTYKKRVNDLAMKMASDVLDVFIARDIAICFNPALDQQPGKTYGEIIRAVFNNDAQPSVSVPYNVSDDSNSQRALGKLTDILNKKEGPEGDVWYAALQARLMKWQSAGTLGQMLSPDLARNLRLQP